MTRDQLRQHLKAAVDASLRAGALMKAHASRAKTVKASTQHDIKLELDERCQRLIEKRLRLALPQAAILGEEGVLGTPEARLRWVVDPIDGTVNFAYGIPHACVSIALQQRADPGLPASGVQCGDCFVTLLGVVHDPFVGETFTAMRGGPARVNGRLIHTSNRDRLETAIVAVGFSKTRRSLEETLPAFARLTHRVRKLRIMGAAALSLAYVAAGRMDAYVERHLRLWDIAAGGLLVECAGGCFEMRPLGSALHAYQIRASNGPLQRSLARLVPW